MHPDLEPLLKYSVKQADRWLRDRGRVGVFGAFLAEDGTPTFMNLIVDPEYELPTSTSGLVEFVRAQLREIPTSGAAFCTRVLLPQPDGGTLNGIQVHLDHIEDATGHVVTLPYVKDEEGEIRYFKHVYQESDDLILRR
jgi:hypothetical protein